MVFMFFMFMILSQDPVTGKLEQFVAIHNNKFKGSMYDNLKSIALTFYVEDVMANHSKDVSFKKKINDIYIVLQGKKLHEYKQLNDIATRNPFKFYAYYNKIKAGSNNKKQSGIDHRNENKESTDTRILKHDQRNDINYRAKQCKWMMDNIGSKTGEQWIEESQKLWDNVCYVVYTLCFIFTPVIIFRVIKN